MLNKYWIPSAETPEDFRNIALFAEAGEFNPLHCSSDLSDKAWKQASAIADELTGHPNFPGYATTETPNEVQRMFWYLYSLMLEDGAI